MPSDTLDPPDAQAAAALERRARLPVARDRPRVLGLQPGSQRDLARAQGGRPGPRRSARRWPGRSTARSSCRLAVLGYGAPGNTQLSRSYGRLHARPLERSDARLPLRPGARPPHPRSGRLEARPGRRAAQGRRARGVRARLRRRSEREAGGAADPLLGQGRRHRDRRPHLRHREADQSRVPRGRRRQAAARLRHPALVDRRRPDAGVPALAVHEGPDRRLERLRLHQRALRGALQGTRSRRPTSPRA